MEKLLKSIMLGRGRAPADSENHPDTSETINISSLALLKMLRHARSGIPLEVMGLMLGTFVDDYTINVVDVFAMPQSGTSVTVESVDPVYQTKHMDLLKLVGRAENVVGWYHSHPGFGCWLSSVDVNTQHSFEALHPRAVAVVVDPVQSVRGKVMLDAFRSINPLNLHLRALAPTAGPQQTTSHYGHTCRPSMVSIVHGLGTKYYSIIVSYRLLEREQKMLECINRKSWMERLKPRAPTKVVAENEENIKEMNRLLTLFSKEISDSKSDGKATKREQDAKKYGKLNVKHRLEEISGNLLHENVVHQVNCMLNTQGAK